jgi:hypothetical protein
MVHHGHIGGRDEVKSYIDIFVSCMYMEEVNVVLFHLVDFH